MKPVKLTPYAKATNTYSCRPTRSAEQVQVDRRLLMFIPWAVTQKRSVGWSITKPLPKGGTVTASATETITCTDIMTFLGFLKLCQDQPEQLVLHSAIRINDAETEKLMAITMPEWRMCELVAGDHNQTAFRESVERLSSYTITWKFSDSKQFMTRLVWTYVFDQGMASIVVATNMLEYMSKHGWLVYLGKLRKLRGNISRTLALYLSQQHTPSIRQETLEPLLWGNDAPVSGTARKLILKAGAELVKAKIIPYCNSRKANGVHYIDFAKKNP